MSKRILSKYNTLKSITNKAKELYLPYNTAKNLYSTAEKNVDESNIKILDKAEESANLIVSPDLSNESLDDPTPIVWNVRKLDPNSKYYSQIYEKGSGRKIIVPEGAVHPDPDIHAKLHKSAIDYESKDPNGVYPEIPDDQYRVSFWDFPPATMADRIELVFGIFRQQQWQIE